MENNNRNMEWQEFVDSHNERCKVYEEVSKLTYEEIKELLALIRNEQASSEQIITFAKLYICNQISNCDIDVNKVIPALNGDLQRDFINALGIAVVEGYVVDDSFIESSYGQAFLKEWINVEEVINMLDSDVLEELSKKGYQEAFDYLVLYGRWESYHISERSFLEFLIESERAGVDISPWNDDIVDELDYGDEEFASALASCEAYNYLDRDNLCAYDG